MNEQGEEMEHPILPHTPYATLMGSIGDYPVAVAIPTSTAHRSVRGTAATVKMLRIADRQKSLTYAHDMQAIRVARDRS